MLSEETHAAGVADEKIATKENAAHEKRNWVRLTYECNNRCTFCLDSDTHNGEMRAREDVKAQILDGRKKGATRLILSGGEPTIHPNYVDFIKLGALAGYEKIQTVTNGRLFGYGFFLKKCVDAGLTEITFSLHGPNAKIHDALVGVPGAFEQESQGLKNAIADGRPVVNVDIVINKGNVKHLAEMLELFISWGVREFDLLQVVPFGRAFTEGRQSLFYDLEEQRPYLLKALEFARRPDLHIWLNRFPPAHLEGFEELIQDPYKLNDEVRGRKEEFAGLLDRGVDLDCRDPARCKYCYLEKLCDTLYGVKKALAEQAFEVVRIDTQWEAQQQPVFGGDPASARRYAAEAAVWEAPPDPALGLKLPVLGGAVQKPVPVAELVAAAKPKAVWVVAPHVEAARSALAAYPGVEAVELELEEYRGLEPGPFAGKRVVRCVAASSEQARALLEVPGDFEVALLLTRESAEWLKTLPSIPPRLVLKQPTHERLTESKEHDVDLRAFFAGFKHEVPTEGIPACVTGRAPRERPVVLDSAMMTPEGGLEIFRFTKRYILERYWTKSLRCKGCRFEAKCEGMHVNYVRAHGYGVMQPVG
jgi:MoaA/NifB/PqqE/SkfB family radical SAM enzyme